METSPLQSATGKPVTLREAEATLEQGRLFGLYLDTAAEGFFRFMLGKDYLDILAKAYVQPGHDLSYQHVTFAEIDGNIIGMVSGFSAQSHRQSSPRILADAAGTWNVRFWLVSLLFAPLIRILDTIQDGDFYLQAIAVDESVRGQGVGSVLLDQADRIASEHGAKRITLDVSKTNDNAYRIYQKRGYEVESTWPRYIRIPSIMFIRMAKVLDSTPGQERSKKNHREE